MPSGCVEQADAPFLPILNEAHPVDRSRCLRLDTWPCQRSRTLARWRLRLLKFEEEIQYGLGVKHNVANIMSRLNTDGLEEASVEDYIACFIIQFGKNGQEKETQVGTILHEEQEFHHAIIEKDLPDGVFAVEGEEYAPAIKEDFLREQAPDRYWMSLPRFVGHNDRHVEVDREGYFVRRSTLNSLLQNVMPASLHQKVLQLAHGPWLACHPGGKIMYYTLSRDFY